MKKYTVILMAFLTTLALCSIGFAADNESEPGTSIEVTDDLTPASTLTFNFSPSVAAQYLTPGTTGNEQAFTIGAYHGGGSYFYGTASTETTIYKKARTTSQTFGDAGFPEPAVDADGNPITDAEGNPTMTGSNSPWQTEGSGWEK